ncbi:MAG TPA: alpha/beta hydrolase [Stellaceae bacterium]|jgi:triacylglycerol lipase|nr:alpha/beta hydrolase [Stellaceae bacterium]
MNLGMRILSLAIGAWALAAIAPAAAQQKYPIDPAIAAKLRAIGPVVNVPEAAKIYLPLQEKAPKDGVKPILNLAYGRDPLQKLDVYEPTAHPAEPMPVLIYIHGGGFTRGDKANPGSPFYANLGYWFGRHGVVVVLANYRLAPKDKWPAGAKDMAGIVAWTHAHIADYGGDRKRIFLMGESAGAAHVAAYALEKRFQPLAGPGLAGAILFSGLYDPAFETAAGPRFGMIGPGAPNENYYGTDLSHYPMHAPMKHLTGPKLPVLIIENELDPLIMQVEAGMLFGALCERDKDCPRILWVPYHVHGSAMFTVNTPDEWMANQLLDFIRAPTR